MWRNEGEQFGSAYDLTARNRNQLRSVPENQISTSEEQAHKADARSDQGKLKNDAISGHGRKIERLRKSAIEFDF